MTLVVLSSLLDGSLHRLTFEDTSTITEYLGKDGEWVIDLEEFNISYQPYPSIKAQVWLTS